ncbi:unnamed protein product [Aphanomyces euteiches]
MFGGQQQRSGFGFGSTTTPAFGAQPSSGFGGFGAAAPSASPFGAPAAASPFGGANTTPAFGTASSFGAPAAAPATSAFGNTSTGTSVGFGGFGSAATSAPFGQTAPTAAASPFGAPAAAPAASPFGGGMFGSTTAAAAPKPAFGGFGAPAAAAPSAFGTTSTFGATPAAGTSAFGAPATTLGGGFGSSFGAPAATNPSPFGQPSSTGFGFGQAPATTSAFGAAPAATSTFGGFGAAPAAAPAGNQVGTGAPAYKTTAEQENEKNKPITTVHFQSIAKMPEYQHKSTEELRWEDYLKRTDPAAAQAQAALVANTASAGGFSSAFGQTNTASAFGKPPLPTSGFGQTTSGFGTNAFGSTNPSFGATTTPAFGAATTQAAPAFTTASSAFGSGTSNAFRGPSTFGSGAFGSTTAPATTTAPGGFSFGGTTTSTPAFGATAAPSAFGTTTTGGFGSTPTTGGFGSTTTTGGFGSTPATGGFGSSTGGFGSTSTTGGFGSTAPSSGFGFGSTAPAATTGGFGFNKTSTTTGGFGTTPTTTGGFGSFGSTTAATTGGFGTAPSTTSGGGFNFGAPKPATSGFGSFGTTSTAPATGGFGSFGSTSTTPSFSLAPTTNTGFGFGNKSATTAPATGTGGFFGSTTSAFTMPSSFGTTTGGFGQPQTAAPAQPATLVAGHDTHPYGTGSFGAGLIEKQIQTTLTLPVVPSSSSSSSTSSSASTTSAARRELERPHKPITTVAGLRFHLSKPLTPTSASSPTVADARGFATSKFKSLATKNLTIDTPPPKLSRPTEKPQVIPETISLSFKNGDKTYSWSGDSDATLEIVWPVVAAQVKPAKLTGWRQNGKKLELHALVSSVDASHPIELDVVEPEQPSTRTGDSFDSFYEKEREKELSCRAVNPLAPILTKEGYYTLPEYSTLCTMSTAELKAVDHFVVGCKGMGCVQWYGTTDVTGLNLDELVLFAPKEVIVYPNEDDKHVLGEGLNKPALVELLHIYPPEDPNKRAQYIDRVKARTEHMDASFVDYQPDSGVWKFKVEHFSRYGFDDDDENDADAAQAAAKQSTLQHMATHLQLNPARLHALQSLYLAKNASNTSSLVLEFPHHQPSTLPRLVIQEPVTPIQPQPPAPKRFAVVKSDASPVSKLWNGPMTSLDIGMSMGRSVRAACFGPDGRLVIVSRHRQVHVHTAVVAPATVESLPLLTAHRAISAVENHHATLPSDISADVHAFVDAAVPSAQLMWKLVTALYGQEHGVVFPVDGERRDVFVSRWFEQATANKVVKSNGLEGILSALCQHKIVLAAQRASQMGNFRLAMLLSQAQAYEGSEVRVQLREQLTQWGAQSTMRYMEKELGWIYSLLAGSVGVVTQQASSSMDWIQMLALFVWYNQGPTSLDKALKEYQMQVQKSLCKPALAGMKPDILMELMQLACDGKTSLESVLSATSDAATAWHLSAVLSSLPGQPLRLTAKGQSIVYRDYMSQLLHAGLIEEAIYVALTISSTEEREATVRGILHRHVTPETSLAPLAALVPRKWIHEAQAIQRLSVGDLAGAVEHYMSATAFAAAHDIVVESLVFAALFRQDTNDIQNILESLELQADKIPQWTTRGSVILAYLRLRQDKTSVTLESVLALGDQLKAWQERPLHTLGRDKEVEVACLSNMLTYVTEVALLLLDPSSTSSLWLDRLHGYVQADCFGESFRALALVRACASFADE